jgi:energy-coupling factor transporter ATP-binding protein EcfA2
MIAILESQVEDLRKSLNRFRVCATQQPQDDKATPLPQGFLPPHADILVFGPSGSGKSSLIRTFYMALHKTQQVPPDFAERIIVKDTAMNEGTLKYVSAVIKPATVDHRGNATSSAIMCHDTRGQIWMDEREQKQLGVMLDGNVKDNVLVQQRNYRYARLLWEFWRKDSELFPQEILVRRNGIQTKPHAILFVFDGSMEEIPDGEEETRFYREIIQMTKAKGYKHPQVVLTRIDRVEESLCRTSPAAGAKDPLTSTGSSGDLSLRLRQVLDRKIEDVVAKLDVGRNAVHFIENYHSGGGNVAEGRNASVDFHALKILSQCCQHADAFVAQNIRGGSGGAAPKPSGCMLQ